MFNQVTVSRKGSFF